MFITKSFPFLFFNWTFVLMDESVKLELLLGKYKTFMLPPLCLFSASMIDEWTCRVTQTPKISPSSTRGLDFSRTFQTNSPLKLLFSTQDIGGNFLRNKTGVDVLNSMKQSNNVNNVANFQIKQESGKQARSRKIRRRRMRKAQDLFVATNRACPKLSCPGVT